MKTLDEVIKALEDLGEFVAECNYCSAEYCNESYAGDKCYLGEALNYLREYRMQLDDIVAKRKKLEAEIDRYQEAVRNCEEAENKYRMLKGELEGFPSNMKMNIRW